MIVCIIQARLASTRLPRKILADLGGRPVLAHVIERALAIRNVDKVVVNCPKADIADLFMFGDPLEWIPGARPRVVMWPYQEPPDVLRSYAECAAQHDADIIVRLTGDCPLLCPFTAAAVVRHVRDGVTEFASNDTTCSGYPDGTDVEVFTSKLLARAHQVADDPYDREHVTPWMRRHAQLTSWLEVWNPPAAGLKLSIDTEADLDRVRRIYAAIEPASLHLSATLAAARKVGEWQ